MAEAAAGSESRRRSSSSGSGGWLGAELAPAKPLVSVVGSEFEIEFVSAWKAECACGVRRSSKAPSVRGESSGSSFTSRAPQRSS
eukprot:2844781-Pleurochrysis_carterae.AAC.2